MRTDLIHPASMPPTDVSPSGPEASEAVNRLRAALTESAAAAVAAGLELETWMQAAWGAYMEQRPGLRAHLEEVQLTGQLDELRRQGKMALA